MNRFQTLLSISTCAATIWPGTKRVFCRALLITGPAAMSVHSSNGLVGRALHLTLAGRVTLGWVDRADLGSADARGAARVSRDGGSNPKRVTGRTV